MAYTKCSQRDEKFHLRITSTDALESLKSKEDNGEVLCNGCFRNIEELDVVQIISTNANVPEAEVGDVGAVVMVHTNTNGFEIECVLENGDTKWLRPFTREQVKWLQSPA